MSILSIAFLSVALRYPGEHEIGVDSFFIHTLAQSISINGNAAWTSNVLAYFGWYPVSYPSGALFLLSSASQLAVISMEPTILLTSMMLGLVGLLTAVLMAREFRPDPLFELTVALVYGIAPRFLLSTLWQASTRNLFMAILPLFIWSIMRLHRTRSITDLSLCFLIVFLLAAAHRLVALVPVIVLAYLVALVILRGYRLLRRLYPRFVMSSALKGRIRWAALGITFVAGTGFLFGTPVLAQYSTGELSTGSSVQVELFNLVVSLARSIGLAAPLAVIGIVYAPWLRNIGFREVFCISAVVAMVPTLFLRLYTGFYVLPFLAVIGSYGLYAMIQWLAARRQAVRFVVVTTAVSVVLFSGLVLHYEASLNPSMSSDIYSASLYLAEGGAQPTVVCNERTTCSQIAAVGGFRIVPAAGGTPDDPSPEMLIFGFYSPSDVRQHLARVPLQDVNFNSNSLFIVIGLDPNNDYVSLVRSNFGQISDGLSARYHPTYFLEIASGVGVFYGENGVAYPSPLANSLRAEAYSVFDGGSETIWWMWPPSVVVPQG